MIKIVQISGALGILFFLASIGVGLTSISPALYLSGLAILCLVNLVMLIISIVLLRQGKPENRKGAIRGIAFNFAALFLTAGLLGAIYYVLAYAYYG